jgi:hypothetical protein
MTLRTPRLRSAVAAASAEARLVTGIPVRVAASVSLGVKLVAEGIDRVGKCGGGGWVEDGGDTVGVGECETVFDGGEGKFELGDEDGGGGDERGGLVDLGGSEFEAGSRDDNDGVLSLGGIDEDGGCSGRVQAGEDVLSVDSLFAVKGTSDLAEGVGTEFGDEGDVGSGAGCGYRLVGAFAAWT